MEAEVEVLEPNSVCFSKQAALREIRVPIQSIIVNGEQKVAYGKACALVCPTCNAIIQQFQPDISNVDILKGLNTDDEEQLNATVFCRACGQKLRLMRPLPIIQEGDSE